MAGLTLALDDQRGVETAVELHADVRVLEVRPGVGRGVSAGVMLFRGDSARRSGLGTQDRGALAILDERFARGEIDRED